MILDRVQVDSIEWAYGERFEDYGMLNLIETVRALRKLLADLSRHDYDRFTEEELEQIGVALGA